MNSTGGIVSGVSVSHHDATVDQLEELSFDDQQVAVSTLLEKPGVREAFVLQTCNRVEAYVVTSDPRLGRAAVTDFTSEASGEIVRELGHEESLRHLMRVSAGLESLVVGEDQILGQVRDAYEDARSVDAIGPVLEDGITKAIRVGERARTETEINEGVVSLGSAAVKMAAETRGLVGATATVVGTGEMGSLAAKRLADRVEQLRLVNRTLSNARSLADTLDANSAAVEVTDLDSLPAVFADSDVVVTATASKGHVVSESDLEDAGETFVVDIARPRDIPPGVEEREEIILYDLDDLEQVTKKTERMRERAASAVESIVDEEFDRLLAQYKRKRADEVISAMYESAERVKASELEEAFQTLDVDEEERATIEAMADSIVSQLLAAPTDSLRDAAAEDDWSTIHTALQLFDPHFGPDEDAVSPAFATAMQWNADGQPPEPQREDSD